MNAQLTARQKAIIPLLLSSSVEAACRQAKIRKPTVYQWLKQDAFKKALEQAQNEVWRSGIARVKGSVAKAVETLIELLDNEEPSIRLRASQAILDHATKLAAAEELERRVALLEERLGAPGAQWPH